MSRTDPEPSFSQTVLDIRAAVDGSEQAYTRLFERHYARILRATALRLGIRVESCDADVENAVQDVFWEVFERLRRGALAGIDTPGGFRRYVARAARNRVVDQRRRRDAECRGAGRVRRLSSVLGDASSSLLGLVAEPASGVVEKALGSDLEARVEQAVLQLEEPYRTAIELSYVCGMSPSEIAATGELRSRRDRSPVRKAAHVRLILHRARQRLRDVLRPDLGIERETVESDPRPE